MFIPKCVFIRTIFVFKKRKKKRGKNSKQDYCHLSVSRKDCVVSESLVACQATFVDFLLRLQYYIIL